MNKPVYTVEDISSLIHVSPIRVRAAITQEPLTASKKKGKPLPRLAAKRIGKNYLILAKDLHAWLELLEDA